MDLDGNNSDDTSDDDYVPGKDSDEEVVSEASDVESDASGDGEENAGQCRKRKLSKTKTVDKPSKRKGGIRLEDGESGKVDAGSDAEAVDDVAVVGEESAAEREEKERERANSLWKDFIKDSELKPNQTKSVLTSPEETSDSSTKTNHSVVTKEFNFAGEVVRVTAVDSNSTKSKKIGSASDRIEVENEHNSTSPQSNSTVKKPGGLNSVLNKISGLKKMSTLVLLSDVKTQIIWEKLDDFEEKSRLDWNIFKEDEGISDDLKSFNRGKNGYLENQAFLQRADERQFEIEKDFRVSRSKR